MKLVLIPGMDGTGLLFSKLIEQLNNFDILVLPLPSDSDQNYSALTEYINVRLPKEDYIIVAESFSGPIGMSLASKDNIYFKGLICVATFISPPRQFLPKILSKLPLKCMLNLPFTSPMLKFFILGRSAKQEDVVNFREVVKGVPEGILHRRIESVVGFDLKFNKVSKPVLYIQAGSDRLVPVGCAQEFSRYCLNFTLEVVDGPHFILQSKPGECAKVIESWLGWDK